MTQKKQQSKIAISMMNVVLQEIPETEKTKEYVSDLFGRCLDYAQNELSKKPSAVDNLNLD
jgi:hypothetical protein